ncbi:MAG TPA: hypothetical protein VGG61_13760, partial [Gemmataceae bacterium]
MSVPAKKHPKPASREQADVPDHLPRDLLVKVFVCVALAMFSVLAYAPSFDYPFINFDDDAYVTQNDHVQAGLSGANIRWAFATFECGNWHPLTWLSLLLDSSLQGGLNPGGFHLTNVLLHTASALVLFLVLCGMSGRIGRSAVVAALFALHPLNVEPVAWVAERKGVLSTLFWMLTLAAYLYFVRRPSVGRYALVTVALALGLMAKPMLMTLPAVLLLLDYWPLQRWRSVQAPASAAAVTPALAILSPRRLLLEKAPLVGLVIGWSVIAYVSQSSVGALPSFAQYPLSVRVW